MGYIRHNAIVVTGNVGPEWVGLFRDTRKEAIRLFGDLVSPLIKSDVNGYISFFVAPDGNKEDWDESNEHDEKRKQLGDFIDSLAFDDGSTFIQFVDVAFDDRNEAEIDRTNKPVSE